MASFLAFYLRKNVILLALLYVFSQEYKGHGADFT
ncbi:hypothetical protein VME0621_04029 [Vibrio mediterranei]|nr:hypothetical protein VME0621_04029 [Vibrio mediterranei]